MPKIVCIDGNIGAGKSTILEELTRRGYNVFQENLNKWGWFLDRFYLEKPRWSFTLQIAILNSLCDQYLTMKQMEDSVVFVERSPESSMIFGKNAFVQGNMSLEEFTVYEECFRKFIWYPDISIFIDTPIDVCMNRIQERGRKCEKTVERLYLEQLQDGYDTIPFHTKVSGMQTPHEIADQIEDIVGRR